jgi:probable O-glycosylation ligase (exosortase A-associated)
MKGLIATYVLTCGGTLGGIYNPFIGLLVYVCFAIIRPDSLWFWSVPIFNYSRVVAIGLLLGWALHGFGSWNLGRGRAVVLCLVLFVVWAAVLVPQSNDPDLAWKFVEEHLKIVLPFLVGVTTIRTVKQLKQLAWVIVLSMGYLAFEFNLSYYEGFNRIQQTDFCGMDNNCMAITMDACIGLAFFLGLHARGWWRKALAFGAALLMAHAVMFSFSRGGLLGLIITAVFAFVLIRKQPQHYLALLVAVLIGFRLAGPEVVERFGTVFVDSEQRDSSAQSRVRQWQACADSMLETPWGVGPNQWRYKSLASGLPSMEAHSYWLQTGAELGFPGFLLLACFFGLCAWRLWPLARQRVAVPDPWLTYLAQMVIASLIGFAISAQFVSVLGIEIPFYIALIGVCTLKIAHQQATNPTRSGPVAHGTTRPELPSWAY